jgi:anti-sigma factor RsiW
MNSAHLESLLLDREFGELPPAVTALLDAYLADHPDDDAHAVELSATVQLARRAVVPPAQAPSPQLNFEPLRRAAGPLRASLFPGELYRLAACLALGLGVGWFARVSSLPADSEGLAPPLAIATADTATEPRSSFWSVARLAADQLPSNRTAPSLRHPAR